MGNSVIPLEDLSIRFEQWPRDTLQISYVGFQPYSLLLNDSLIRRANDTLFGY